MLFYTTGLHESVTDLTQEGCLVKGQYYDLGSPFAFEDGCSQYNCQCFLDGSWDCPARATENICDEETKKIKKNMTVFFNIQGCLVKGQRYPLGRPFSFVDSCYKYHCDCQQDGGWECPATQTENICQQRKEQKVGKEMAWDFYSSIEIQPEGYQASSCLVEGTEYPLGRPFYFRNRCFRFNCQCKSDGSWNCPAKGAENLCAGRNVDEYAVSRSYRVVKSMVNSCYAKGRYYTLERPFSFVDGCFRYNCLCNQLGSWECSSDQAEYICQGSANSEKLERQHQFYSRSVVVSGGTKVKFCVVQGLRHPLGRPFSFTYGCFRHMCDCLTNGSWVCPEEKAQFICHQQRDASRKTYTWSMYIISNRNIRSCRVNNFEYPLGRTFSFIEDCFRYRCNCHSDGSWECPAKRTEYSCGPQGRDHSKGTHSVKRVGSIGSFVVTSLYHIRYCYVQGQQHYLGQQFSFTEGCFKYSCMCYHNGSWDCPASQSQYVCPYTDGSSVATVSSKRFYVIFDPNPQNCLANDQKYRLGDRFSFILDCFRYNCQCFMNGSWECPADRSEYVCHEETQTWTTRRPSRPHTKTETNEGNIGTVVVTSLFDITHCEVNNVKYSLGREFSFTEGCFQYQCMCYRNGSWECPSSQSRYTCPLDQDISIQPVSSKRFYVVYQTDVDSCLANNQKYRLGDRFSFVLDCFRYNCQCFMNGSWECPADRSEYVCHDERQTWPTRRPSRPHTKTETNEGNIGTVVVTSLFDITHCEVNNVKYSLGREFSFTEGCFQYQCMCYRNGSWECPSSQSRYTCPLDQDISIQPVSSKRFYVVYQTDVDSCLANNQKYRLGDRFSFVLDCFRYNCQCFMNGSWECPADRSEYVCHDERQTWPTRRPSRPHTKTETNEGNIGSVVVTSLFDITHCEVNNVKYSLGREFSFTEGCFQYQCMCYRNGSWECPSSQSRYTCPLDQDISIQPVSSKRFYVVYQTDVDSCLANNQKYRLGDRFSFVLDCFRYNCQCFMNGSWECPADRSEYVCRDERQTWPTRRPSRPHTKTETNEGNIGTVVVTSLFDITHCEVNNVKYSLGREFSFTEGCFQYQCMCYRNGSWECPSSQSRYTCPLDQDISIQPVSSKRFYVVYQTDVDSCLANNQKYRLGDRFSFVLDCFRYNCQCFMNGSWECPADRSEYVCRDERQTWPTRRPSRPHTKTETNEGNIGTVVVTSLFDITHCEVNNVKYSLGREFSFTEGCFQYQCMCYRNGSWECPSSQSRYTCPLDQDISIQPVSSKRFYVVYQTDVDSCLANNQKYRLGDRFSFVLDCFRYNCQCFMNGSWECPADRSEYVCRDERQTWPTRRPSRPHTKTETNEGNIGTVVVTSLFDITHCEVNNVKYSLGREFSFTEGCFQYQCMCYRNGSWECPSSQSRYTCPLDQDISIQPVSSKRFYVVYQTDVDSCQANNQKYRLGDRFSFVLDCFRYNCQCFMNGSWECPADRSEYVCRDERQTWPTRRPSRPHTKTETNEGNIGTVVVTSLFDITHCEVNNVKYSLGREFSFTEGCFQYQCMCYRNGSWECPSSQSRYTCPLDQDISIQPVSSKRFYVVYQTDVDSCLANNQKYRLGDRFSFVLDCFRYNCQCFMNGSWECPADRSEYVCRDERQTWPTRRPSRPHTKTETNEGNIGTIVVTSLFDITHCEVNNVKYSLGREFSFTEGCFQYQCMCYRNGSWECPSSQSRYTCPLDQDISIQPVSSKRFYVVYQTDVDSCQANNQKYRLGDRFSFVLDCFRYNCQCFMNGSWECPADRSEYVCRDERQTWTTRRPSRPHTKTETNEGNIGTVVVTSLFDITHCEVNNVKYSLGREFSFTEGCFQYQCMCYRNGSWECPSSQSRYTCPLDQDISIQPVSSKRFYVVYQTDVDSCQANNQKYRLGDRFSFVLDCFRYNCQCFMNGSWECPADRSEYVCRDERQTWPTRRPSRPHTKTETNEGNIGTVVVTSLFDITHCEVNNVKYSLGREFSFTEGCFQYQCMCYRNGSWECPSSQSRYTCPLDQDISIQPVSSKRFYVVYQTDVDSCQANNQKYRLGDRFSFVLDCFRYNCQCFMNGSWECPADRSEYVCRDERQTWPTRRPSRPHTKTETNEANIGTVVVTSLFDITHCEVNNVKYSLGREFSFTEGCFQYQCMCYRNGSWECPSSQSRYTCPLDQDISIQPVSSKRFYVVYQTDVDSCQANNQKYRLGDRFSFVLDCFRYNCQCFMNGSWECPADRSEYVCRDERQTWPTRRPSRPHTKTETNEGNIGTVVVTSLFDITHCEVNNVKYSLGREFSFTEGCFQYQCMCYRNGSWECPSSQSRYTCPLDQDISIQPVSSKRFYVVYQTDVDSCQANNQKYRLGDRFSFVLDCFRYNCQCFMNGSWECPADRSEYVCRDERPTWPTRRPSRPHTRPDTTNTRPKPRTNEVYQQSVVLNIGESVSSCNVYGTKHPLNHPFTFTDQCYRYVCQCYTNGSWECPGSRAEYICQLDTQPQQQEKISSRSLYIEYSDDPTMCEVNNKKYPLGRRFMFERDCFRYHCYCNTDGSWQCLSEDTQNICDKSHSRKHHDGADHDGDDDDSYYSAYHPKIFQRSVVVRMTDTIRHCTVNGNQYTLGEDFTFTDGCFQYHCQCYRNGSVECLGENADYICGDQQTQHTRRTSTMKWYIIQSNEMMTSCIVNGRVYPLGQAFTFQSGCFQFHCLCNTDGSWECADTGMQYICNRQGDRRRQHSNTWEQVFQQSVVVRTTDTIRHCTVNGNQYTLGEDFTFTDGCFQYHCQCYRNGSVECPGENADYICGDQQTQHTRRTSSRNIYIIVSEDPVSCMVKGNKYPLGRPFSFNDGCFQYQCECKTDGSWQCPAENSKYICDQTGHIRTQTSGCLQCRVKGESFASEQPFTFEDGCYEYNCRCNCDGSYDCPAERTVSKCDICRNCTVDGMKFPGGIGFKRRLGCKAVNCKCHCNGTYICFPEQTSTLPCNTDIAHSGSPKSTTPIPYTLSGTLEPIKGPASPAVLGISKGWVTQTPPSLYTASPHNQYSGSRDHVNVTNTDEIHLDLENKADSSIAIQGALLIHNRKDILNKLENGSRSIHEAYAFNISSNRKLNKNTRPGRCQKCHVYNKVQAGNTKFRFVEGCYEYLCDCYCDGSWTCPDNLTVDTCKKNKKSCVIDGRSYRLNSTFINQIDSCTEQTCICNPDGNYNCLQDTTVNTCKATKECYKCNARGQIIQPKSNFQIKEGCYKYKCRCNCDGSWNCPGETAVNLCKKKVKCIKCNAYGTIAAPKSNFQLDKDCIRYQCRCNCDGSWNCPGESAVRICRSACIKCNAKGVIAQPDSDFILRQECIKYRCRCNCDGSWNCPGEDAINVCETDERTGCRYCNVKGDRKKGNSRFELKEGCYRYQCTCRCDGGWNCPAETAVNECTPRCQQCNVRGKMHEPNSRFTLQEDCFKYSCVCNCDGSWRCPTGEDTCNTDPESGCYYCDVRGQKKKGHTRFELEDKCYKYQCVCNCDGSWKCPAATAINICQKNKTACLNCLVNGRTYQGNLPFSREENCYKYQCFCNCDGSWNCPADSAEYICGRETERVRNCRQCDARGKTYAGNTEFQLDENCYRYTCNCNCDGSWNCPADNAKYICGGHTGSCRQCEVHGKTHEGNTEFEYKQNCYLYKCKCNCDGSWNCPAETADYVCEEKSKDCRQCNVDRNVYAGNSEFQYDQNCYRYKCKCNCDGSWNCPAENAKYICGKDNGRRGNEKTGKCRKCDVKGNTYTGNSEFQYEENCFRYKCKCNCDGSWNCPSENAKYICGDSLLQSDRSCTSCRVNNEVIQGNTAFIINEHCNQQMCNCFCNGTWKCPTNKTMNLCSSVSQLNCSLSDQTQSCYIEGKSYSVGVSFYQQEGCRKNLCTCQCNGVIDCFQTTQMPNCTSDSATECKDCIKQGKLYRGNSKFNYQSGCYKYTCFCGCDGEIACPTDKTVNICAAIIHTTTTEAPSSCRDCRVNNETYKGNTQFTYKRDCMLYQCTCSCNGKWQCPADTAVSTCDSEPQATLAPINSTNCRSCFIKHQSYKGNTVFFLINACYRYRCKCSCDGSWECPTQTAVDICKGLQGQSDRQCTNCNVKGQLYKGGEDFDLLEACFKYKCSCDCEGKWNCPSQQPENVCTYEEPPTETCLQCEVKGKKHVGNQWFTYKQGCRRFQCKCRCNGNWHCPKHLTANVCSVAKDKVKSDGTCKSCVVRGNKYAGDSFFSFDRNCLRFRCSCNCDGTWNCLAGPATNICSRKRLIGFCKKCYIGEKGFQGNSTFKYDFGCTRYQCRCFCDGKFFCPGDKTEPICGKERPPSSAIVRKKPTNVCENCTLNDKSFRGNSNFRYTLNCFQYECHCGCDGIWSCPPERSVNICAKTKLSDCNQCIINGYHYKGDSQFKKQIDCYEYTCTCYCNGSWVCPAEKARYICENRCHSCIEKGYAYQGGSTAVIQRGCKKMECICSCNGTWSCEVLSDTCSLSGLLAPRDRCDSCSLHGKLFPGNSWFSRIDGCLEYNCKCNCNGHWTCESDNVNNLCVDHTTTETPSSTTTNYAARFIGCKVNGRMYYTSTFTYIHKCMFYNCTCNNGKHHCPHRLSQKIC
ncbi:hypothetical protein Ahia01_000821300 [Argonauta hians]